MGKRGFGEICEGSRGLGQVEWPHAGLQGWCCAVAGGVALCCVGWCCAVLHCIVSNCGTVRDV